MKPNGIGSKRIESMGAEISVKIMAQKIAFFLVDTFSLIPSLMTTLPWAKKVSLAANSAGAAP